MSFARDIARLDRERPVLIAGPTAAGKSALALEIADRLGGVIINADALQIYACWQVLTARPSPADTARHRHLLYGHVGKAEDYSVGHWLRDVTPHLAGPRPIIVGGTGLYFQALTAGLAEIPEIPSEVRAEADRRLAADGPAPLLAELDAETAARIDQQNPVRIQRAWEVLRATGRGLAAWQDETGPPALPLSAAQPLLIEADRDWLAARIATRFDQMLAHGALDEVRQNLADWDPTRPWSRAIGAAALVAHLKGEMSLAAAKSAATIATRQYAKRQRTWFRARMRDWPAISLP